MKLPIVCLVGRTNVGKSALFNRIARQKVKSLVFDKEHVTRDYIETVVNHQSAPFRLIDTGGVFVEKNTDVLTNLAKDRAFEVMNEAAVVLFVCDGKVGIVEQDRQVLRLIRKLNKEVILVVNKVDNEALKLEASEFCRLGIDNIFYTSAVHGFGLDDLMNFILSKTFDQNRAEALEQKRLAKANAADEDASESDDLELVDENDTLFRVAIIGKPNVGKSSLLNLLCQKERSIVADVEGTTREAIKVNVGFNHQLIELIDTPGVRRQASVNENLEQMMVRSALASVRTSDLVILMIDGSKGSFCNQELKLLNYGLESKKAVLVVINKIDLMTEDTKANIEFILKEYEFIFKKVPMLRISCLDKIGIGRVRTHLEELWQRCQTKFDTDVVTQLVKEQMIRRPLYKQRQLLKIFKVRAIKAKVPTFQLYVNQPKLFAQAELSCIENILRKKYDLRGCPVVLRTVNVN